MKTEIQHFAPMSNEIVKINKLHELSLQQQRFWIYSLQIMHRKLANSKSSNMPIDWVFIRSGKITFEEFAELFNIGMDNQKAFRGSIKSMLQFHLMIEYKNEDERYFPVFADWLFKRGSNLITWRFNDVFDELFLNLSKGFFKLSIEEIVTFESTHAITLYMLLKSKLEMVKKEHTFTMEELRLTLCLEKKYKLYGHFKTRVLDMAKKYIDQSPASSFSFEYNPIKHGKKVVAIEFILSDKRKEGSYYESKGLLPHYVQNQIYKRIYKLSTHEDTIIAGASLQLLDVFHEEKCINLEQTLCKMNIEVINKRLEKLGDKPLKIT
jgi:plasmid replication initiation protein